MSGYLDTGLRAERERRARQNQNASFFSKELEFEETLRVNVSGYSYHPRFLRYRLGVETQGLQRVVNEGTRRFIVGGNNRQLLGGDARFTFLEEHPYNLALYGNVSESDVERSFARTIRIRTTVYGATANYRRGPLPLAVTYQRWTRKHSDIDSKLDENGQDLIARAQYAMGEDSHGNLQYRLRNSDVSALGLKLLRQEFVATNTSYFGAERSRRFFGSVRFDDQDNTIGAGIATSPGEPIGRFRTRNIYGLGNFDWRHTDAFTSHYHTDLQRTETRDQLATVWNTNVALQHKLYQSLTSRAEVYASLSDASFGGTDTYGSRLTEDYAKELGDWGRLNVGITAFTELQDRKPGQETGSVLNEPHGLGSDPIELIQRDIDAATIVVTNQDGTITYVLNQDYIVTTRGRIVEIRRLITGSIGDGETVVVDYDFRLSTASAVLFPGLNHHTSFSIGRWLTLYVRTTNRSQLLLEGRADNKLESYDGYTTGVRNSWRGLTTVVEYEDVRSSFVTYRGLLESVSVSTPVRSRVQGRAAGSHFYQKYTDTDETVSRINLDAGVTARVWQRGSLGVEGEYARESWTGTRSGNNDLDGFGFKAHLTWSYRNVNFSVEGRLSRIDQRGEKQDQDRLVLRMRREF